MRMPFLVCSSKLTILVIFCSLISCLGELIKEDIGEANKTLDKIIFCWPLIQFLKMNHSLSCIGFNKVIQEYPT